MPSNNRSKFESDRTYINDEIRSSKLRVIDHNGDNLGVISTDKALDIAREAGLDLIEVSPGANPPVAKITDYGKWKYDQSKKAKEIKAKSSTTETKEVQIKIGTSDHDVELKAKRASEWLSDGDRVKIELYVRGRTKYTMSEDFFKDRLHRLLKLIATDYRLAEPMRKGPKGYYLVVERASKKGAAKKLTDEGEGSVTPEPKITTESAENSTDDN